MLNQLIKHDEESDERGICQSGHLEDVFSDLL